MTDRRKAKLTEKLVFKDDTCQQCFIKKAMLTIDDDASKKFCGENCLKRFKMELFKRETELCLKVLQDTVTNNSCIIEPVGSTSSNGIDIPASLPVIVEQRTSQECQMNHVDVKHFPIDARTSRVGTSHSQSQRKTHKRRNNQPRPHPYYALNKKYWQNLKLTQERDKLGVTELTTSDHSRTLSNGSSNSSDMSVVQTLSTVDKTKNNCAFINEDQPSCHQETTIFESTPRYKLLDVPQLTQPPNVPHNSTCHKSQFELTQTLTDHPDRQFSPKLPPVPLCHPPQTATIPQTTEATMTLSSLPYVILPCPFLVPFPIPFPFPMVITEAEETRLKTMMSESNNTNAKIINSKQKRSTFSIDRLLLAAEASTTKMDDSKNDDVLNDIRVKQEVDEELD